MIIFPVLSRSRARCACGQGLTDYHGDFRSLRMSQATSLALSTGYLQQTSHEHFRWLSSGMQPCFAQNPICGSSILPRAGLVSNAIRVTLFVANNLQQPSDDSLDGQTRPRGATKVVASLPSMVIRRSNSGLFHSQNQLSVKGSMLSYLFRPLMSCMRAWHRKSRGLSAAY